MLHSYLQPVDDGLPMRESRPYVCDKLEYIKRYVNTFSTSMKNQKWHSINYIDLFAGHGKYKVVARNNEKFLLGSALLALTASTPYDNYFFCELDLDIFDSLAKRCKESPIFNRVKLFCGDSNILVNEIGSIIKKLDSMKPSNKWNSLNLAILDPEGLELKWKTISLLAQCKRMDLIIYYPEMALNREMGNQIKADRSLIDDFFGTQEWRNIYSQHEHGKPGKHRKLINLYIGNLKKHGYQILEQDPPLIRNSRRGPLYRLLFASKHPLGYEFWNNVTNTDSGGQPKLF
jgi:three-Cys-motif partner protein